MSEPFLPPPATYLGDSVYVRYEGWGTAIRLYLDNGSGPHTEIVLEPEVLNSLEVWLKLLRERVENFLEEEKKT